MIAITINRRECHTYYFVCSVAKSVQKESLANNLFFTSAVLPFVISTSFPIATTNTVLSNTSAFFGYLFHTSENENSAAIVRKSPKLGMNFNTPLLEFCPDTFCCKNKSGALVLQVLQDFSVSSFEEFPTRHALERHGFHPDHGSPPHPPVRVRQLLVRPRCFV